MSTIAPETALVYAFSAVTMSAVDSAMSDNELRTIGEIVKHLPAFRNFDTGRLIPIAKECLDSAGRWRPRRRVRSGQGCLAGTARETACVLAVEVASDLVVGQGGVAASPDLARRARHREADRRRHRTRRPRRYATVRELTRPCRRRFPFPSARHRCGRRSCAGRRRPHRPRRSRDARESALRRHRTMSTPCSPMSCANGWTIS